MPLINATRTALRANPDDAIVVANLRTLFGIFDDPATPRVTRYQQRTRTLGGDTVGVGMSIDWMNDDYRRRNPGSPPRSGAQGTLMSKLETDPGAASPDKYIRGHLLNEHLGGEGDAPNLFPITGNANSRHLHSTESRVPRWVDVPTNWVFYEVTVDGISSRLNSSDVTQNYVNATLNCRAVLKDEDTINRIALQILDGTYDGGICAKSMHVCQRLTEAFSAACSFSPASDVARCLVKQMHECGSGE